MRRGCGDAANFFGESRDSSKLIFECANPRCLRKMTSAASYVTRALLVLGAIMNSLIALKYIAGSKASTVESLGPIGKLFKPEYIDRGLGAMAAFAGVAYINVCVVNVVAAFAFDDTAAATVLLIFAIVFMLIMSAMRSFYMDPKLYLEGATKKASGLQTIIGVVCLISAIATLSQPPPPTHTAGA